MTKRDTHGSAALDADAEKLKALGLDPGLTHGNVLDWLDGAAAHELKTSPEYFNAVQSGLKTFEYRRDDRTPRYAVHDVLRLREWQPNYSHGEDQYGCLASFPPHYTGRELLVVVTYVARGGIIPPGFCVMSVVRA